MNVACLQVSVQNLLSICLVSKDINIKICGTIVLPSWFVCVCETWCHNIKERTYSAGFQEQAAKHVWA
jgi:hypothetical protein